jgi:hypothetical protein
MAGDHVITHIVLLEGFIAELLSGGGIGRRAWCRLQGHKSRLAGSLPSHCVSREGIVFSGELGGLICREIGDGLLNGHEGVASAESAAKTTTATATRAATAEATCSAATASAAAETTGSARACAATATTGEANCRAHGESQCCCKYVLLHENSFNKEMK